MTPAAQFFALADTTRCRVVEMLSQRPMPVHELTAAFAISRPAISRHLRVLKEARLVKESKRGRENVYALQTQALEPLQAWLAQRGPGQSAPAKATKPAKPKVARVAKPAAPRPVEVVVKEKPVVLVEPVLKAAARRPVRQPPVAPVAQAQLDLF